MKLKHWLCRALGCEKQKKPKKGIRFGYIIGLPILKKKGPQMPLELTITNEQKIPVKLAPQTAGGKPAEVDEPPTWTKISGEATIVVADDGMSAELISSDTPGDSQFLVEADADLGEGVEPISDTIKLTTQGARAANLGLSAGDPVQK